MLENAKRALLSGGGDESCVLRYLIAHSLVLTTGALRNKLHITLATPAGL